MRPITAVSDRTLSLTTLMASFIFAAIAMYALCTNAFAADVTPSNDLPPMSTSNLSDEASKIDPALMHICTIKMGVIKFVMDHRKDLTVDKALETWELDYAKVKSDVPSQTEIDTSRVIRDIYRLTPTLKTKDDEDVFIDTETGWCLRVGY